MYIYTVQYTYVHNILYNRVARVGKIIISLHRKVRNNSIVEY